MIVEVTKMAIFQGIFSEMKGRTVFQMFALRARVHICLLSLTYEYTRFGVQAAVHGKHGIFGLVT